MLAQMDNASAEAARWVTVAIIATGLVITAVAMVGSAVWAVASIRGSARALGRSIDALRTTVERLDGVVGDCVRRVAHIEGRMAACASCRTTEAISERGPDPVPTGQETPTK